MKRPSRKCRPPIVRFSWPPPSCSEVLPRADCPNQLGARTFSSARLETDKAPAISLLPIHADENVRAPFHLGDTSSRGARLGLFGLLLLTATMHGATFTDWEHRQQINIPASGLIKIPLPPDTLDSAQPNLADLRVADSAGNEVPYFIERAEPSPELFHRPKIFETSLNSRTTILAIEIGVKQPLIGLTLATPEFSFIKSVRLEGSNNKTKWEKILDGQPIFRQPNGANQLYLAFAPASWNYLRATIDDARSQPIPFTGAMLRVEGEKSPTESFPVAIRERDEFPGQTRLTLNFGAAHLPLTDLIVETTEPLFTRQVTLATQEVEENVIHEKALARGTIFRVALENEATVSQLRLSINSASPRRELLLLIQNDDNPPISITAIRAERRPIYLLFRAAQPGDFVLFSGNEKVPAPRYDLAALGRNLKSVPVNSLRFSSIAANPNYVPAETLPEIATLGAPLDISSWRFRKPVILSRAGVQQLELDLDILAHAQPHIADLRLMKDKRQVPFILERTSLSRALALNVSPANDSKKPRLSRWTLHLSPTNLPITKITCQTKTALFKRRVVLHELRKNEMGETITNILGEAEWIKTPGASSREFALPISKPPLSDTLFLEIDNEDNAPIDLENFQAFYPVSRIWFKTAGDSSLELFYGNQNVGFPNYDLSLVASQLLAADKNLAKTDGEEFVKTPSESGAVLKNKPGIIFWIVLGLVVVGLLAVISRLLPKTAS